MKVHCFISVKHASCRAVANGGADSPAGVVLHAPVRTCLTNIIHTFSSPHTKTLTSVATEEMQSPKPCTTYQEDLEGKDGQRQVLTRRGRKWGSCTVLPGAQNHRVATLDKAGSPLNGEAPVSIGPESPTLKYIPARKEGICSHKMSPLMVELLIRARKDLHMMDQSAIKPN